MSQEITLTASLAVSNGSYKDSMTPSTLKINQTNQLGLSGSKSFSTSDTAFTTTGLTTLGLMMIQNLDPTNYIDIGPDSGGAIIPFIRLKAGEFAVFRLKPGITFRTQANTAAVICEWLLLDD